MPSDDRFKSDPVADKADKAKDPNKTRDAVDRDPGYDADLEDTVPRSPRRVRPGGRTPKDELP